MRGKWAIEVQGLSYRYPDGTPALEEIDLNISQGESVALVGPNGAGKSTLLLHLNGILRGRQGEVRILGEPVNGRNLKRVRSSVGLLFQDPDDQLFCSTLYQDVAFGPTNLGLPSEVIRKRVTEALSRVGLSGLEGKVPHHLSAGQKKRAALATILAMEPEILALDEPTSHLDPQGAREFIDLLQSLPATKVLVTHELPVALEICQRIVVLEKGRIRLDAPIDDLLTDGNALEDYRLYFGYNCKLCLGVKAGH